MTNLAVLLTVHNRKDKTLAAIDSVFSNENLNDVHIKVYMVDDGCVDGTPQAVADKFPQVMIIPGAGNLFWNGGMRKAFEVASKYNFDYYLWINDDTTIYTDSIRRLINQSKELGPNVILVGSTLDPDTREHTYGGVRRAGKWRPLKFLPVLPGDEPMPVDTMNGNCVLIPRKVAETVGNLDPSFTHGIGDYDYGLRARSMGIKVVIATGYVGTCKRNDIINTWKDPNASTGIRWADIRKINHLPPKEWAIFSRRYAGVLWPIFWASPYLRVLIPNLGYISERVRNFLNEEKSNEVDE